jgi:esterase/lipase
LWNFVRSQPAPDEWSERHLPSPGDDSFHYNAESIGAYLQAARQRVEKNRTDLDGRQDAWIIEGNSPFVLEPESGGRPANAILMVHGLTDSPFAMRDMAGFFQRQGFYVLAMQLPGHGTRPGDLLRMRWHDWVKAHQHLLGLLQQKADNIYAFGFSAGATLSVYQSLLNPVIKGLFLFAPALSVTPLARLMAPLSSLGRRWRRLAWFDIQPDTDCFKYESLANRAIAEVYAMSRTVRYLSTIGDRSVPLFIAASERDAALHSRGILNWFSQQTGPRKMLYYSTGSPRVPDHVKCLPARFPDQRIQSYAHTSLIQSPSNPHYGAHGTQRFCTHYYRPDPLKYQRCKAGQEDCLGEMFDESEDCCVIRRLTYNPMFEEMLGEIRDFMVATGVAGLD